MLAKFEAIHRARRERLLSIALPWSTAQLQAMSLQELHETMQTPDLHSSEMDKLIQVLDDLGLSDGLLEYQMALSLNSHVESDQATSATAASS